MAAAASPARGGFDDPPAGGDGGLADGEKRRARVGLGDVDVDPPDVVVAGAQDGEGSLGVAAADGLGQLGDRACEAVDAAEDDDPVPDRDTGRWLGRGHRLVRDLGEARTCGLAHQQRVGSGADDVAEHGAGLDRRELLRVADEDHARVAADRLE